MDSENKGFTRKKLSPKEKTEKLLKVIKDSELKLEKLKNNRRQEVLKLLYKISPDIGDVEDDILKIAFKEMADKLNEIQL